jgi:hypothetical protein
MALRDGHLVARMAWWARPEAGQPYLLDILDIDDAQRPGAVDTATRLLTTAIAEVIPAGARPPDYIRFLTPGWREEAAERQAVEDRMAAAGRCGARFSWKG